MEADKVDESRKPIPTGQNSPLCCKCDEGWRVDKGAVQIPEDGMRRLNDWRGDFPGIVERVMTSEQGEGEQLNF